MYKSQRATNQIAPSLGHAGRELARLHLDYEELEPYKLKFIETEGVPLSYRVEDKMRLSKDKTELKVNRSLTLAGLPPEVLQYRLGNRSALEWVIDQYQVTEDKRSAIRSDPNRATSSPSEMRNGVGMHPRPNQVRPTPAGAGANRLHNAKLAR